MLTVTVDSLPVLLVNIGGAVRAYEDRCPHAANPLSLGSVDGDLLTCAAHQWVFDCRSGRGINPPTACLSDVTVLVAGDTISVNVGASR